MSIQLLLIDPQNDFCKPQGEVIVHSLNNNMDEMVKKFNQKGSLFVDGADKDMVCLTDFVKNYGSKIDEINVTLDQHHTVDIAHPIFWVDKDNNHPNPFTVITAEDVDNGIWRTFNPIHQAKAVKYVHKLKENNRYSLCIWNPHCIIGTEGQLVVPALSDALIDWEINVGKNVNYINKGSNMFTEHYSAIIADVINKDDPSTLLNVDILEKLALADIILVGGEALNYCVANTVRDIVHYLGDKIASKIVLLTNTCSNVAGTEYLGDKFLKDMNVKGMRVSTTFDFFK